MFSEFLQGARQGETDNQNYFYSSFTIREDLSRYYWLRNFSIRDLCIFKHFKIRKLRKYESTAEILPILTAKQG